LPWPVSDALVAHEHDPAVPTGDREPFAIRYPWSGDGATRCSWIQHVMADQTQSLQDIWGKAGVEVIDQPVVGSSGRLKLPPKSRMHMFDWNGVAHRNLIWRFPRKVGLGDGLRANSTYLGHTEYEPRVECDRRFLAERMHALGDPLGVEVDLAKEQLHGLTPQELPTRAPMDSERSLRLPVEVAVPMDRQRSVRHPIEVAEV